MAIELPEGKVKYNDPRLAALEKKDKPKKVVPLFVEFIRDELVHVEAIVIPEENLLDLLILDIEKVETRLERAESEEERALLTRAQEELENETPLCDLELTPEEREILVKADPLSLKPVIRIAGDESPNEIIEKALDQTGYMFFYTTGPTESHAWLIKQGSDIITCAAKIHSDLARGFIKGDVVSFDDYLAHHTFNDCKAKGAARVVDRDYIIQPGEIIEIRFNV
jgi:ribosome-binding ATPase YchF (GTP1/OBG family)